MNIVSTGIPDVFIIKPTVFRDDRGFFYEGYNKQALKERAGIGCDFVQDNYSRSSKGVIRGLHYQIRGAQAKLVKVLRGAVFDVAVDLRRSSKTFGKWVGVTLDAVDNHMMWIPEGFAHGFLVLSESADVMYKTSDFYSPRHERCIAWNDGSLAIDWPAEGEPVISDKDKLGVSLRDAELFE